MYFLILLSCSLIIINATAPIRVEVPTSHSDKNRALYKGIANSKGTIVWRDSTPLSREAKFKQIKFGESLFNSHCANCHSKNLMDKLTGPALWGMHKKTSYSWFKYFTLNSQAMIAAIDKRAIANWNEYKPTMMPNYPVVDSIIDIDKDISAIWAWIADKSDKIPSPVSALSQKDKIAPYELDSIFFRKAQNDYAALLASSSRIDQFSDDDFSTDTIFNQQLKMLDSISTYIGKIKNWNWYNNDELKNSNFNNVEFNISLTSLEVDFNNSTSTFNTYIVFEEGKSLISVCISDTFTLVLDCETLAIKTKLPIGQKAYILSFGFINDKFYAAKKNFVISEKNIFEISYKPSSEAEIKTIIDRLR